MSDFDGVIDLGLRVGEADIPEAPADETDAAVLHREHEAGIARSVIPEGLAKVTRRVERSEPCMEHRAGTLDQQRQASVCGSAAQARHERLAERSESGVRVVTFQHSQS